MLHHTTLGLVILGADPADDPRNFKISYWSYHFDGICL